jgi:hypothetical protein
VLRFQFAFHQKNASQLFVPPERFRDIGPRILFLGQNPQGHLEVFYSSEWLAFLLHHDDLIKGADDNLIKGAVDNFVKGAVDNFVKGTAVLKI